VKEEDKDVETGRTLGKESCKNYHLNTGFVSLELFLRWGQRGEELPKEEGVKSNAGVQ